MKKCSIAVMVGLLAVPFSGAMGQSRDLASIPDRGAYTGTVYDGEYVIFFDSNGNRLSPAAIATVRKAAEAARSAPVISVEGRADYANAVKAELVRHGAPAEAIRIRPPATSQALQKVGMSDPIDRRVEIGF